MNALDPVRTPTCLEQVYLLERDAGLLCRILGLYAARGIHVLGADYTYAAQNVMKLQVSVGMAQDGTDEVVRVLVDKAASFIGVLAACEHERDQRRAA